MRSGTITLLSSSYDVNKLGASAIFASLSKTEADGHATAARARGERAQVVRRRLTVHGIRLDVYCVIFNRED